MASRRRARVRTAPDPQTELIHAEIEANARPHSRERKRLIAARERFAARVITASPAITDSTLVEVA